MIILGVVTRRAGHLGFPEVSGGTIHTLVQVAVVATHFLMLSDEGEFRVFGVIKGSVAPARQGVALAAIRTHPASM
ncbi:MAG TPA: hypothetical protein EYG54_06985 [Myxococcales bacterium]|nr:hypothetical protein [Myxococcales bacterium]